MPGAVEGGQHRRPHLGRLRLSRRRATLWPNNRKNAGRPRNTVRVAGRPGTPGRVSNKVWGRVMYTGNKRKVIGVWVFTAYDTGDVDVTQTAPDKDQFALVRRAISNIGRWCRNTLKNAALCPYSPDNTSVISDEDGTSKKPHIDGAGVLDG